MKIKTNPRGDTLARKLSISNPSVKMPNQGYHARGNLPCNLNSRRVTKYTAGQR